MSVHYKFKNTINYDAVKFDGVYISASDLKANIAQLKKLGHSDLRLENEETKQVYNDDQMIPKNTNIIVSRIPSNNPRKPNRSAASQPYPNRSSANTTSVYNNNKKLNNNNNNNNNYNGNSQNQNQNQNNARHNSDGGGREAMELVSRANMSEEEKIKYIQSQSTKDFEPNHYARSNRGGGGGPNRGGIGGGGGRYYHHHRHQPANLVKRTTGIPRDFLMKAEKGDKGALMTPSGEYAVPAIDREAYNNPKVEKGPFFDEDS